ncbi:ArdC family protein [Chloroflexota bacterium]
MKQLKEEVENIQDSYQFRLFLTTMSKFHYYSIGNQILIMLQKPDALRVAGFNAWRALGRFVKKGEKGISMLSPVMPPRSICASCGSKITKGAKYCPQCGEPTDQDVGGDPVFFRVVYVFDLHQTEGRDLPEFDVPVLTGACSQDLVSCRPRSLSKDTMQV